MFYNLTGWGNCYILVTIRLSIKKILFPVQRVAKIEASRAAANLFIFHFFFFPHENIVNFWKKKKNGKMKKFPAAPF